MTVKEHKKRRLVWFTPTAGIRAVPFLALALALALALFGLTTSATSGGFTARIGNSTDTAATAPYFTCTAAVLADSSSALFAYKLNEAATTTTNSAPAAIYEAENAALSGGAASTTNHNNYSGTGFVGGYTDNNKGTAKTTFTVNANVSATYSLTLRYSNATGASKTLSLKIDSGTTQQITLPATASWDSWATSTITASWPAGTSHVVSYAYGTNDTANVNLDYLYVSSGDTSVDSFIGTTGTLLQNHTGETGATWAKRSVLGATDDAVLTPAGRIRKANASYAALYTTTAVPTSANYTVSAAIEDLSSVTNDMAGVVGRFDATNANGTFYVARYDALNAVFILARYVNGTYTSLGTSPAAPFVTGTVRISLDMNGSTIRLLTNNTQRVSVTDTTITGAGAAGVAFGFQYTAAGAQSTAITDTTGLHLDNFISTQDGTTTTAATTVTTDFSGNSGAGTYQGSMTSGPTPTASGCPRDPGGAYNLDGTTSYVSTPIQITNPQIFTVEVWFKTTVGSGKLIGFGNAQTGSSGQYDRHIFVATTGQLIFGTYNGTNHVITSPSAYTDGQWHQAVATLSGAGMALYVDGKIVATDPATTTAENHAGYWRIGYDNLNGWASTGTNYYFTGSMRFAAVYTTALTATQISTHYAAGQ
ncbi:LamG-like jellyroll fold domain-containing protein [Subtercola vilae]|nr:LamG-like jellyroll fold domain-containing protein [Subtercola vilae]